MENQEELNPTANEFKEYPPLQIYKNTNDTVELIPEGAYDCTISSAKQDVRNDFFNPGSAKVGIEMEFTIDSEGPMKGRHALNFFNPAITPQSTLRSLCVAVMGRDFLPEELALVNGLDDVKGFLLEKPVMVVVKNRVSAKGKKYYTANDFLASPRRVLDKVAEAQHARPATVLPMNDVRTLQANAASPQVVEEAKPVSSGKEKLTAEDLKDFTKEGPLD